MQFLANTSGFGGLGQFGVRRGDWGAAAALLSLAFLTRWLSTGAEIYGDESWYLYLARTLGREPAAATDQAWFHLLNRPLYYLIFKLGAFRGFAEFRWFGSAVGALAVACVYLVARDLGAPRWSAVFAGCLLTFERWTVEYSAHGFPDTLASLFALLSIWAAGHGRRRGASMCAFAACAVLSKESFVALPLIAVFVRAQVIGVPTALRDRWTWLTILLPTSYVAFVTTLGWVTPGVHMQGWSHTALSLRHARAMGVGPEVWPLLGWLAFRARWSLLVIWLGLPAFYLLWSLGLGRGLSPWYVLGPASLSALAAALSLGELRAAVQRLSGRRASAVLFVAAACLTPMSLRGALRTGGQLLALRHGLPRVDDAPQVKALLQRVDAQRVLVVNCFWSYGYSHLRATAEPARRAFWSGDASVSSMAVALGEVDVGIFCATPELPALRQRLSGAGFETLLSNRDYWVVQGGAGKSADIPPQ